MIPVVSLLRVNMTTVYLGGGVVWVSGLAGLVQGVHHPDHLLASDADTVDGERHHQQGDGETDQHPEHLTTACREE